MAWFWKKERRGLGRDLPSQSPANFVQESAVSSATLQSSSGRFKSRSSPSRLLRAKMEISNKLFRFARCLADATYLAGLSAHRLARDPCAWLFGGCPTFALACSMAYAVYSWIPPIYRLDTALSLHCGSRWAWDRW